MYAFFSYHIGSCAVIYYKILVQFEVLLHSIPGDAPWVEQVGHYWLICILLLRKIEGVHAKLQHWNRKQGVQMLIQLHPFLRLFGSHFELVWFQHQVTTSFKIVSSVSNNSEVKFLRAASVGVLAANSCTAMEGNLSS